MSRRFVLVGLLWLMVASVASAKVKVVSSIPDLGSIAAFVGGEFVEVKSIARGNADAHRVEVLPSYMVRVSKAALYLKVGLYLDQWADQIIDGSRNDNLLVVDCSHDIHALEVPQSRPDARQGDIHPLGNPHYWLDPRNAAVVAQTIAAGLARVDPEHAGAYEANAATFEQQCAQLFTRGQAALAPLQQRAFVSYHTSWSYFANAFDLRVALTVEPVPGIPPTAKHLSDLVEVIRERELQVLLQEPYFSQEAGEFLARETGIHMITAAPSCDDVKPQSYFEHLQRLLDELAATNEES